MAKKLPLLVPLLLTLTISTLAATVPNQASAITHGARFWTIPQLIEMKAKADTELDELTEHCAGDRECKDDIFFERLESDGKYLAIDNFSNMILMVTAINSSNSTVRVMFHDEDPMLERMIGEKQRATLSELHIAWFTKPPVMYNSYYAVYGNYEEGMYHNLYSGFAAENDEDWLAPNVEVELEINDAASLYNEPYIIYFTMEADITSVSGVHDYSDCLTSPAYKEGMECRMVFDEVGGFYFLPFLPGATTPVAISDATEPEPSEPADKPSVAPSAEEPTTPSPTPTLDPESIADPNPTPEPEIIPNPEPATPAEFESDMGRINEASGMSLAANITLDPKTPDTGTQTYPDATYGREIEMPWWIAGLIISGIGLLIWWFIPNRHNLHQNPQKSSKKS